MFEFRNYNSELIHLENFTMSNIIDKELIEFSDASEKAYSDFHYLNDLYEISPFLIGAKTRAMLL